VTIRVLHVLSSSGIGGTEVSTLRLARETQDLLETAFLILASRGPISEAIERAGFPIAHAPATSLVTTLRALPTIVRILRDSNAHIVHTYGLRAHLLGRTLGRLAGKRCIVGGLRSLTGTSSQGEHWLWLDRLTFPLSCGYVSNSDAAIERFAENGYPRARLWRIHNGVDLDLFRPATPDERRAAREGMGIAGDCVVMTCVASLRPVKNHRLLFQAVGKLDDRVLLLLIGDGPLQGDLERDARELGMEDRVRFVGRVTTDELPRVLGASDLCVLTSDSEGLPTSLLEAMACGLPVVAASVGGIPELVINGETGLLVPPGDVEALTEAIRAVEADDRLRERMGRAGRERAEKAFGLRRMADAYVEVYRKLVSDRRA